jgi:hypothetical protein
MEGGVELELATEADEGEHSAGGPVAVLPPKRPSFFRSRDTMTCCPACTCFRATTRTSAVFEARPATRGKHVSVSQPIDHRTRLDADAA